MQPRETDFVGRAWCGRGLRDRHPSTTRPTARSLPLGARAPGRQGGASTPSRSHSPRTSSARLVDRTATGATRPWRRQRAIASRPLAGPRPARTLTNSPRDTSSCTSDGPLISCRDRAPAAVTVAREPTAASSQPKGCAPTPVPPDEGLHLVLDSTGLSLVGAGEWAAAKHGGRGRRGWRKLHRGVDQSGAILVHTLTEATGDDATTALDLLTAVEGPLVRITVDAAYDTVAVYETATARGATVVIPPARTANVSGHGPRSPARDRTITVVKQLGRRRWKKTSGYHRQSRVENTFFRYKSIIGDGLRARSPTGQGSEVVLGCEILNRMTELGRPVSYRIGR